MEIKVLGTGCAKCTTLYEMVEQTAKELGINCSLEKVTDINDIMSYNVMSTPALVIDGEVVFKGGLPDKKKLVELLGGKTKDNEGCGCDTDKESSCGCGCETTEKKGMLKTAITAILLLFVFGSIAYTFINGNKSESSCGSNENKVCSNTATVCEKTQTVCDNNGDCPSEAAAIETTEPAKVAPETNEQETKTVEEKPQTPSADAVEANNKKIEVYYFHGYKRCKTCHNLENYTKEAVENGFADELKNGKIDLNIVNVEEKANEHFITDFNLVSKTVVIAEVVDGKVTRFENLTKIWTLVSDKEKFVKYITDNVHDFL